MNTAKNLGEAFCLMWTHPAISSISFVRWIIAGCLLALFGFGPSLANAQKKLLEAPCIWLFENKRYARAAECFEAKSKKLSPSQKYYQGRMIRNAALLWKKASVKANPATARRYLQRAILLFDTYISQKMCLEISKCVETKKQKDALCLGMGCGKLRIFVTPKRGEILVRSGSWQKKTTGSWSHDLPPGTYHLRIRGSGFSTQTHKLVLLPRKNRTLRVKLGQPIVPKPITRRKVSKPRHHIPRRKKMAHRRHLPPPKKGFPPMALVGYVGGGILVIAGGVLLGTGYVGRSSFLNETWHNPSVGVASKNAQDPLQNAELVAITGSALLGIGGVLLLTGIFAHAL